MDDGMEDFSRRHLTVENGLLAISLLGLLSQIMASWVLLDFQKDKAVLLDEGFGSQVAPIQKDVMALLLPIIAVMGVSYLLALALGAYDVAKSGNDSRWKMQSMAMIAVFFPFIGPLIYCLFARKSRIRRQRKRRWSA